MLVANFSNVWLQRNGLAFSVNRVFEGSCSAANSVSKLRSPKEPSHIGILKQEDDFRKCFSNRILAFVYHKQSHYY